MYRLNELIHIVAEKGISESIYNLNMLFACILTFFFMYAYRRKYNISFKHYLLTMMVLYPVGYLWMLVYAWIDSGFQTWGVKNIVRIFVYYPVFLWPVAKITRIKLGKLLDYCAPGLTLLQAVDHLACIFPGCCHGYPARWGVWNRMTDSYLFPIQWLESAVAFAILIYLLRKAEWKHFSGDGLVYADFLILYGSTRFLLEFLRDNAKLFFGISGLALHALFMVFVGIIMMLQIRKKKITGTS